MGISYLQLDSEVSRSSAGGPVLDRRGRVVGILAGIGSEGARIGLAVPVNYLRSGADPLLPGARDLEETVRWETVLDTASEVESSQLARLFGEGSRAALIQAEVLGSGEIGAVVARFANRHPQPERREFQVLAKEGSACDLYGEIPWWQPVEERRSLIRKSRLLTWLGGRQRLDEVFVGTCIIDVRGCSAVTQGSDLLLLRGLESSDRVRIESDLR
jgi:hypothetical protein